MVAQNTVRIRLLESERSEGNMFTSSSHDLLGFVLENEKNLQRAELKYTTIFLPF